MSPIGLFLWTRGGLSEQGEAKALFASPQQPRTRQFLEKFLMQ